MDSFFAATAIRWPAGREDYHWHVLPGSERLRERLVQPYGELLEHAGLVPVRPEYMHITIQHLAPVSAISEAELTAIVTIVRDRCASFAPFAVIAGRAEAWETSIVCALRPGYLLGSLWSVVTSATRRVAGSRLAIHPAVYHPHMALAYSTGYAGQMGSGPGWPTALPPRQHSRSPGSSSSRRNTTGARSHFASSAKYR